MTLFILIFSDFGLFLYALKKFGDLMVQNCVNLFQYDVVHRFVLHSRLGNAYFSQKSKNMTTFILIFSNLGLFLSALKKFELLIFQNCVNLFQYNVVHQFVLHSRLGNAYFCQKSKNITLFILIFSNFGLFVSALKKLKLLMVQNCFNLF